MNQALVVVAVAAGGAIGSVLRYWLSQLFLDRLGPGFPWGTLTINITGAFLIGIVLQLAATRVGMSPYIRVFAATGILGGFTTFSTFAYETYILSSAMFSWQSVVYAGSSVVLGVAAAYAGVTLVRLTCGTA